MKSSLLRYSVSQNFFTYLGWSKFGFRPQFSTYFFTSYTNPCEFGLKKSIFVCLGSKNSKKHNIVKLRLADTLPTNHKMAPLPGSLCLNKMVLSEEKNALLGARNTSSFCELWPFKSWDTSVGHPVLKIYLQIDR